jgi:predicted enzyme related to lactoylglutathione lyase
VRPSSPTSSGGQIALRSSPPGSAARPTSVHSPAAPRQLPHRTITTRPFAGSLTRQNQPSMATPCGAIGSPQGRSAPERLYASINVAMQPLALPIGSQPGEFMGRVVHFEIHASDMDRAERFYTGVFGWQSQKFDGPIDYRLINTGPNSEAGIDGALVERRGALAGDGEAVIAYVCTIQVDDIGATEEKVKEAGGEQVVDRQTIPDVGQLSYFKDTEGNVFGAMQASS